MSSRLRIKKRPLPGKAAQLHVSLLKLNRIALPNEEQVPIPPSGTYSRARGIFAGIDLNGASVTQDKDETRVLYGKFIPFSEILSGKVEPPRGTEAFLSTVGKYTSQA